MLTAFSLAGPTLAWWLLNASQVLVEKYCDIWPDFLSLQTRVIFQSREATPSFPSQPEGKIGLPRANPRGRLRSPS